MSQISNYCTFNLEKTDPNAELFQQENHHVPDLILFTSSVCYVSVLAELCVARNKNFKVPIWKKCNNPTQWTALSCDSQCNPQHHAGQRDTFLSSPNCQSCIKRDPQRCSSIPYLLTLMPVTKRFATVKSRAREPGTQDDDIKARNNKEAFNGHCWHLEWPIATQLTPLWLQIQNFGFHLRYYYQIIHLFS